MAGVWSNTGNLITGRGYLAGCGTQSQGLSFGGYYNLKNTEKFDGTVWSNTGNLITGRYQLAGCGTQSQGLSFGGREVLTYVNNTEEYVNGTWSNSNLLNIARGYLAGCGIQDQGLSFGGQISFQQVNNTEEYDGTVWSNSNPLITGRSDLAGCGTQNQGLSFGCYNGSTGINNTEEYDGTVWSNTGNLITGREKLAGCGTQNQGLSFGGFRSDFGILNTTEKYLGFQINYNLLFNSTKIITKNFFTNYNIIKNIEELNFIQNYELNTSITELKNIDYILNFKLFKTCTRDFIVSSYQLLKLNFDFVDVYNLITEYKLIIKYTQDFIVSNYNIYKHREIEFYLPPIKLIREKYLIPLRVKFYAKNKKYLILSTNFSLEKDKSKRIQLVQYEIELLYTRTYYYKVYRVEYQLKLEQKELLQDVSYTPLYDLEQSTNNIFKFINLQKILNLYLTMYYNETFIISNPQFENHIIPKTFTFKLSNLYNNDFIVSLEQDYFPLLKVQIFKQIITMFTPNKNYLEEWNLEYFQKLDKYYYPQNIIKNESDWGITIKLLDNNNKNIIFKEILDQNKFKIDTIFTPFENIELKNIPLTQIYERINCNLYSEFEIKQEQFVSNFKLETFLNRKRFNNIDDYDSSLLFIDGKYISIMNTVSPYYNIFDQKTFNNELEDMNIYLESTGANTSPLKQYMNQNNIETYYFRLNTDKLYSDLFMIDGGIFDIQGQFNIYRRDNHIRFFYIFHKFNHLGYLDFIVICEYIIEDQFMGDYTLISLIDKELNNIYLDLLSYNQLSKFSELKSKIISDKICSIQFVDINDSTKIYNGNIISVNIGNDKIQLRNWSSVNVKDLNGELLNHGNNVYSNLVISSYVFQKSKWTTSNSIFLRDVIKEKNLLSQYNYESFYSWIGVEI